MISNRQYVGPNKQKTNNYVAANNNNNKIISGTFQAKSYKNSGVVNNFGLFDDSVNSYEYKNPILAP